MKFIYTAYYIIFFTLIFSYGCANKNEKVVSVEVDNKEEALIEFEKKIHDFGRISEGEIVSFTFFYQNTGKSNLIVNDIKSSCGCTNTEWTKEPVKPGEKGKIEVMFDSSGRIGKQYKEVTVYSNSALKDIERITIIAEII